MLKFTENMFEKILRITNNPCILKFFTYLEIEFQQLKETFEISVKVRTTHFNISAEVDPAKVIR